MLVAYNEAPTMGQVKLRPARKKLALLSSEWRRRARDRPNPMLPIRAVRQTIQSRVVRDRLNNMGVAPLCHAWLILASRGAIFSAHFAHSSPSKFRIVRADP
jgi:hypothetical protein